MSIDGAQYGKLHPKTFSFPPNVHNLCFSSLCIGVDSVLQERTNDYSANIVMSTHASF